VISKSVKAVLSSTVEQKNAVGELISGVKAFYESACRTCARPSQIAQSSAHDPLTDYGGCKWGPGVEKRSGLSLGYRRTGGFRGERQGGWGLIKKGPFQKDGCMSSAEV